MRKFTLVMAMDSQFGIGKDNGLPWHDPDDLKSFYRTTVDRVVIMGHNTWVSLPFKPLMKRLNVVISSDSSIVTGENLIVIDPTGLTDLQLAQEINRVVPANYTEDDMLVIGGKGLAEKLRFNINQMHITHIEGNYDCDVFYNPFGETAEEIREWELMDNTPTHRTTTYRRK